MNRNPRKRTKRQEMADGWASFCMLSDPIAAWESLYSPKRITIDEPILGGISATIAPFVYLKDVGTSESLEAELEAIRTTAASVRRRGLSLSDDGTETAKRIDALGKNIERMRHAATMAEKLLRKYEYMYDPKTGQVHEAAKRRGGGRGLLLNTIIRRIGTEYGTDAAARDKIKKILSPIFELDAGPRGKIAKALENLKR